MKPAAQRLPVFALSSRKLGGAASMRAFQEATYGAFASIPDGLVSPGDFRIELRATHLGSLVMTKAAICAHRFERNRRMVATTGLDHLYMVLYTAGGSTGTVEGRDFHVRTGDICFLDLTRQRETRSEDFHNITLMIPRPLLEGHGVDVDALHGLVLKREQPLTAMLVAHLQALVQHARDLSAAEAETMGAATVALIASLIGQNMGGSRALSAPSPRRQLLRYIDANLGDPALGPAQLMDAFGLSRAALYRMFEQEGGVAEFIRARRLTEAALALGSGNGRQPRISEVARRLGFADDSGFSRAFRARFGIAPTAARNQAAALWEAVRNSDGDNADLGRWLRTLRR